MGEVTASSDQSVHVRQLSGEGRSAVAVWSLTGTADALDRLEQQCLVPGRRGRVRLIDFGPPPAESSVYVRTAAEHAELQTHGGQSVAERVRKTLDECGCIPPPHRFDVECQQAFASATTRRTARELARVCFGRLEAELLRLRDADAAEQAEGLRSLLAASSYGLRLTTPATVALYGPANVGKSSLLNRLLGYERAISEDRPGVTRDPVAGETALDGWPIRLVDTAGLRETGDVLEAAGIASGRTAVGGADVRVLVTDGRDGVPAGPAEQATLIVRHKADLWMQQAEQRDDRYARVSSLTGEGVDTLLDRIAETVRHDPPSPDAVFFVTSRQVAAARELLMQIATGDDGTAAWDDLLRPA